MQRRESPMRNAILIVMIVACVLCQGCAQNSVGSSSKPNDVLARYEQTVDSYVPKMKAAKNMAEFSALVTQLSGEVNQFIEEFNAVSDQIDPSEFSAYQRKLNSINAKFAALCRR